MCTRIYTYTYIASRGLGTTGHWVLPHDSNAYVSTRPAVPTPLARALPRPARAARGTWARSTAGTSLCPGSSASPASRTTRPLRKGLSWSKSASAWDARRVSVRVPSVRSRQCHPTAAARPDRCAAEVYARRCACLVTASEYVCFSSLLPLAQDGLAHASACAPPWRTLAEEKESRTTAK